MAQFKPGLMIFLIMVVSWSAQAYQNPILLPGAISDGVADPCAIKWMGKYYLYCTRAWETPGMQVWESADLVNWTDKGLCSTDTFVDIAWAPDVFYYNGTFYMYVAQGNPDTKHKILSADNPLGPFTNVSDNTGVISIDGQVFMDDDGTLYFSFAATGGIRYRTMSSPTSIDGPEQQLTSCEINVSNTWTEAPHIFKRDGRYYMHYSGHDYLTNYRVHSAKGNSVANLSPQGNNPILIEQAGDTYRNVGHNYVILGPDLKTHYSLYHAMDPSPGTYRRLMVDKLAFDGATGDCSADGPSYTPKAAPLGPAWQDGFDRSSTGAGWINEEGGSWGLSGNQLMWGDSTGGMAWSRQVGTTPTADDYIAEFNVRLVGNGTTSAYPKYGVFSSYDADNMFIAWVDAPNNLIATWAKVGGVDQSWINSAALPAGWDHTQWHNLRIEKQGSTVKVFYDNMLKVTRTLNLPGGKIGTVLEDCHADFGWCAFSNLGADDLHPGTIGNSQLISETTDPTAFNSVAAATGTGAVSYKWQQATSTDGPWSDIAGANGATYAFPNQNGMHAQNTVLYARRTATDNTAKIYYSNVVTLDIRKAIAAGTVAHWRFENGMAGVVHAGDRDNFYTDISGNGNHMSSWWPGARPTATSDVTDSIIPQVGVHNLLALDFAGGNKDLGTFSAVTGAKMAESYHFGEGWTVEATFKLNSLGWQVVVGKDGQRGDLGGAIGGEPPFWLKVMDYNHHLELGVIDDTDSIHVVQTLAPLVVGKWYSVAATYDNVNLRLYLKGEADSDFVFQGSVAFGAGAGLGGFNNSWTIGRGTWGDNAADYVNGRIDEVRIVNMALAPSSFLHAAVAPGYDFDADGLADEWELDYFSSVAVGDPGQDGDGDKLNNLGEFALGGDPTDPADTGYPTSFEQDGAAGFRYVYPRRTAPPNGLAYRLELTDDLVSGVWTNGGYVEVPTTGYIDPEFEAVTNQVPDDGSTRKFIQLIIE